MTQHESALRSPMTLGEVLGTAGLTFCVPLYQRNYDWDATQIDQLLQDIARADPDKSYYLGTLVLFKRAGQSAGAAGPVYEVIDGQQRLTTLCLIAACLRQRNITDFALATAALPLRYQSRPQVEAALHALWNGAHAAKDERAAKDEQEDKSTQSLREAYEIIRRNLRYELGDMRREGAKDAAPPAECDFAKDAAPPAECDFAKKFCEKVLLFPVEVPSDTDLNRYFEIMNNRGEQLEQHEILKAKMAAVLKNKEERGVFCKVWDVCSEMEKYVQTGLPVAARSILFADNCIKLREPGGEPGRERGGELEGERGGELEGELEADAQTASGESHGFALLCAHCAGHSVARSAGEDEEEGAARSLSEILAAVTTKQATPKEQGNNKEGQERFSSVVNFSNFLLHVLLIHSRSKDISLDDNFLQKTFEEHFFKKGKLTEARVKAFACDLLCLRYLYDTYVIKRDFVSENGGWSLKKYVLGNKDAWYVNTFAENTKEVLMLLAAFHVSVPTQSYKYWLHAALSFLYGQEHEVQRTAYLNYLERIAKAFVFDRFLVESGTQADYFTIIYKSEACPTRSISPEAIEPCLRYDTLQSTFVLNYLDYLLWKHEEDGSQFQSFQFAFRNSVEHHYPQHPREGESEINHNALHSLGNICLVSYRANASLSNKTPAEKSADWEKKITTNSLKHLLMQRETQQNRWDVAEIQSHGQEMLELLCKDANADGGGS